MAFIPFPPDDENERPDDQPENLLDSQDGGDEIIEHLADAVSLPESLDSTDVARDALESPLDPRPAPLGDGELPHVANMAEVLADGPLAQRPSEPPRPKFDVTQVAGDSSGTPREIRIIVEFRGLPPELAGQLQADLSASATAAETASEPAEETASTEQVTDSSTPGATSSPDARQSSTRGDSATAAETRGAITVTPDLLQQLLVIAAADRDMVSDTALPVAMPVSLRNTESIITQAIRESGPHWIEKMSEISQQKYDELLYFLYTEERRLNPELR